MSKAGVARGLLIAAPFVLIVVGAGFVFRSPWPIILHLVMTGQHLYAVEPTWTTVGLPAAGLACWAAAIWLSLRITPKRK